MAVAAGWLLLLMFSALGRGSDGSTWCICTSGTNDTTALQAALDYACGNGADCAPINEDGACFLPNTMSQHCSYAVNSYFQSKGQAAGTCDFSGTATITDTDPSPTATCTYPSAGSSTEANATTSATPPPPSTLTPPPPVYALGPTTAGTGVFDHGGLLLAPGLPALLFTVVFSGLLLRP